MVVAAIAMIEQRQRLTPDVRGPNWERRGKDWLIAPYQYTSTLASRSTARDHSSCVPADCVSAK
jgi:hypothetical protein